MPDYALYKWKTVIQFIRLDLPQEGSLAIIISMDSICNSLMIKAVSILSV